MDNLTQRILTAIFGIPLLLIIFYFGDYYFLGFIALIVGLGSYEYFSLIQNKKINTDKLMGIIMCLILPVGAYFGYLFFIFIFTLVSVCTLFLSLKKQEISNTIEEAGSSILGVVYIGWFLSHAVLIRKIDIDHITSGLTSAKDTPDLGFFWIVFVVCCTFLNDTGAYFIGRYKGKHKLAPKISPSKTWEGTVSGVLLAIAGSILVNLIFSHQISYKFALLAGTVIGITSVIGDLIESMFKRSVSIKDSGDLLPGHGGVLDRFDSLILVFPVMYYLILFYYTKGSFSLF